MFLRGRSANCKRDLCFLQAIQDLLTDPVGQRERVIRSGAEKKEFEIELVTRTNQSSNLDKEKEK